MGPEDDATEVSSNAQLDDDATKTSSAALQLQSIPSLVSPSVANVHAQQTLASHGSSRPSTKAPSSDGAPSQSTTVGSPLEALEHDEIMRTRWFCLISTGIAVAGGASAMFLPGDPGATGLLFGAVIIALGAVGFLYWRTHDPIAFRKRSTWLGWFIPALAVTTAIPYFGAFSPVPVVLVLGVYFTGLGKSATLSGAVYAVCAGMQALVALLVLTGTTRDTGLVQPVPMAMRDQIVIQLLVQVVLLATLITARVSRGTALVAVGELERAVRVAAHREALLLEAREELERALRQGRGRFSEQTIGSYQLRTVLGRGAMGEVYEADGPGGKVAVKLLSQASLSNPNHVLRFLRELRTAAAVRSPHIVQVIEVGESPVPYLVMERLQGMTLAEVLRGRKHLAPGEVVDLVAQIGAGITAAAAAGIVHRDLKPQNVFIDRGTWKVLDFGVARAMDGGDTLTAGQVVGTPSYMAPEQAMGGSVDHATDLYALAAIAYRALTGHPPFAAGEIAETLYKVVHTRPRRPSELVTVPPAVDLVLAIGMAKERAYRFASADELSMALAAAFNDNLPASVLDRGRSLERAGAWSSTPLTRGTRRLPIPSQHARQK